MIQMKALRTLTANQSPTGKQIDRGGSYPVETEALALEHERAGMGTRQVPGSPAGDKP